MMFPVAGFRFAAHLSPQGRHLHVRFHVVHFWFVRPHSLVAELLTFDQVAGVRFSVRLRKAYWSCWQSSPDSQSGERRFEPDIRCGGMAERIGSSLQSCARGFEFRYHFSSTKG